MVYGRPCGAGWSSFIWGEPWLSDATNRQNPTYFQPRFKDEHELWFLQFVITFVEKDERHDKIRKHISNSHLDTLIKPYCEGEWSIMFAV